MASFCEHGNKPSGSITFQRMSYTMEMDRELVQLEDENMDKHRKFINNLPKQEGFILWDLT